MFNIFGRKLPASIRDNVSTLDLQIRHECALLTSDQLSDLYQALDISLADDSGRFELLLAFEQLKNLPQFHEHSPETRMEGLGASLEHALTRAHNSDAFKYLAVATLLAWRMSQIEWLLTAKEKFNGEKDLWNTLSMTACLLSLTFSHVTNSDGAAAKAMFPRFAASAQE